MTELENKIIDEIENCRKKNNIHWMNILRIALQEAPERTKVILTTINYYDEEISKLTRKLSAEN